VYSIQLFDRHNFAGMAKKEAALNTIGYICEEIADLETDCLQVVFHIILFLITTTHFFST
jgi:hypothetical protein